MFEQFSCYPEVTWGAAPAVKSVGLPCPQIKSDIFFTITFKRPPYSLKGTADLPVRVTVKVTKKVTKNQETILAEMRANPHITTKKLSEVIGISDRKIKENIKKLKAKKLLKRVGSAKGGYWQIIEK